MAIVLGCGLEVSEFEIHSSYCVHFRTNTPGKGIEPPYSSNNDLNSITAVLQ